MAAEFQRPNRSFQYSPQDQCVLMKRSYSMVRGTQILMPYGRVKMDLTCAILQMECGGAGRTLPPRLHIAIRDLCTTTHKDNSSNSSWLMS